MVTRSTDTQLRSRQRLRCGDPPELSKIGLLAHTLAASDLPDLHHPQEVIQITRRFHCCIHNGLVQLVKGSMQARGGLVLGILRRCRCRRHNLGPMLEVDSDPAEPLMVERAPVCTLLLVHLAQSSTTTTTAAVVVLRAVLEAHGHRLPLAAIRTRGARLLSRRIVERSIRRCSRFRPRWQVCTNASIGWRAVSE